MDEAWRELLNGTGIRIFEEDVFLSNATNVARLKDGGFIGGLGVMHPLHCIVSTLLIYFLYKVP